MGAASRVRDAESLYSLNSPPVAGETLCALDYKKHVTVRSEKRIADFMFLLFCI